MRDVDHRVRFVQLALPNHGDLADLCLAVELRVLRWLKRRGLLYDTTEHKDVDDAPCTKRTYAPRSLATAFSFSISPVASPRLRCVAATARS